MERVTKYVNRQFRHAGNSSEVIKQKEELAADMQDRILELMSKGQTEDEAFANAVISMDGMEELAETLVKNRTVNINKLRFHHSLVVFSLIALAILICGAFYTIGWLTLPDGQQSYMDMPYFTAQTVKDTYTDLGVLLIVAAIYPIVNSVIYLSNPQKVKHLKFDFVKQIKFAIIGWLIVLLILTVINMAPIEKAAGPAVWFTWPLIITAAWPVSRFFYRTQFMSNRYSTR